MGIKHCMFLFRNGTVSAVIKKHGRFSVMLFGGERTIPVSGDFWEKWIEYAGFLREDKADFCIICDEKPRLSERLETSLCEPSESIWSVDRIKEVFETLCVAEPVKVFDERRVLLFSTANRRDRDSTVSLTAVYSHEDGKGVKEQESAEKSTPFIQHMLAKLAEHDNNDY